MIFLVMILIGYVLYGLSNALFTSVWPEMARDLSVDYTLVGMLAMVLTAASGIASAFAFKLRKRFGTNRSMTISLVLFAVSLLIFYISKNIVMVAIALLIMGFGSGLMDATANSYIIKAYDAGKQSFLHACWGLGSSVAPIIMSFAILHTPTYKNGILFSLILFIVSIIVFFVLKASWENSKAKGNVSEEFVKLHSVSDEEKGTNVNIWDAFKIKDGVIFVTCYVMFGATNSAVNSWIATLVVEQRGLPVTVGAMAATCYFVGITGTRLLYGLISNKVKDTSFIFFGIFATIVGLLMFFVKNDSPYFAYAIALVLGIGIAPLIPLMSHSIKYFFEEKYLGMMVSCATFCALIGGSVITALITPVIKLIGIQHVQIFLLIIVFIGLITYKKLLSDKKKS